MGASEKKGAEAEESGQSLHKRVQNATETPHVRRRRARLVQYYLAAATLAFLALMIFSLTSNYFFFDVPFTRELQEFTPGWFETLMLWVSWPGYAPQALILVGVVGLLVAIIGYRWEAASAVIAAALGLGSNLLLKTLIARPRPSPDLVTVIGKLLKTYSFPSGHVTFYVAFFGFLWFLAYTLLKPSALRAALMLVTGLPVLLVGLSRVYLGQHWSSDVLGGYLLGSVVLIAAIAIYRWGKPRFFTRQPGRSKSEPAEAAQRI